MCHLFTPIAFFSKSARAEGLCLNLDRFLDKIKINFFLYEFGVNVDMNSDDLKEIGFENWHYFHEIDDNLIRNKYGVYIIKLNKMFGRLIGNSDILYIGHTTNFSVRFFKNYLKGTGGKTTQRIHRYLINMKYIDKTMISWIETKNYDLERELRDKYEEEHHEFPPWNRYK